MDYAKIQTTILKDRLKLTPKCRIAYEEFENWIAVTYDGYSMFFIPKEKWILDCSKIAEHPTNLASKIMVNTPYAQQVSYTGEAVYPDAKTGWVKKFSCSGFTVSIRDDLLRPFGDDIILLAIADNQPVFVMENTDMQKCRGIVMPWKELKKS